MELLIKILIVGTSTLWFSFSVGEIIGQYHGYHMRYYVASHGGF